MSPGKGRSPSPPPRRFRSPARLACDCLDV
jgi:hypothetical protein